ncbi:hypothetical protein [Deinococcus sp.]|uniref:alginate O-acetyltransferase AlgX-related protein n=1 Tax=Deinococcus sp. TaxID=47478 RepID=UPI0025BA2F4E|nr:hypothetical protein [Deinococcus sp.]
MTTNFEHQHQMKPGGVKGNIDNHQTPTLLHWLPTVFLLAVVGLGAVSVLTQSAVRSWPTGKSLITGEAQAEFEKKNLDANVPWRVPSVALWGGLNYRLFGEARDGAVIGQNGWLFTTEEFQTAPEDAAEIRGKLSYIREVRDELAKSGAKLVVALIPAKTRLYAGELGSTRQPAVWQPVYQEFRHGLEQAGIPAPDLEAALRKAAKPGYEVFLHTDTHWTPFGAVVAAQTLTPVVRKLAPELPAATYAATYAAAQKPVTARRGDLLRYVPAPDGSGPAPDQVQELTYTRADASGGGLLGGDSLAVTLVGTSYSAETAENVWHFGGALSRALGAEVLNAAQAGKGPTVPMREYLKGKDRQENPPKVVIWEIPERFLRVPYPEKQQPKS